MPLVRVVSRVNIMRPNSAEAPIFIKSAWKIPQRGAKLHPYPDVRENKSSRCAGTPRIRNDVVINSKHFTARTKPMQQSVQAFTIIGYPIYFTVTNQLSRALTKAHQRGLAWSAGVSVVQLLISQRKPESENEGKGVAPHLNEEYN